MDNTLNSKLLPLDIFLRVRFYPFFVGYLTKCDYFCEY